MYDSTNKDILTIEQIKSVVKPLAEKYQVEAIYLFGSYARGEAHEDSDLDFLVFSGDKCDPTQVFAIAEELREKFKKSIDAFEICEINKGTPFYNAIMKKRVLVA